MDMKIIRKFHMRGSIFPLDIGYHFDLQGVIKEHVSKKLKTRESSYIIAIGLKKFHRNLVKRKRMMMNNP